MTCRDKEVTFQAVGANTGGVQWEAPVNGGTAGVPKTGQGSTFKTKWIVGKPNPKTVKATCSGVTKTASITVLDARFTDAWPRSARLLVTGRFKLGATSVDGQANPTFKWIPPGTGGSFDPEEAAAPNGSMESTYTAPGNPTDPANFSEEHVSIDYTVGAHTCRFRSPKAINITAPSLPVEYRLLGGNLNAKKDGFLRNWRTNVLGDRELNVIDQSVAYHVYDQFGEGKRSLINQSDRGIDKLVLVNKEDVAFETDFPALAEKWQQIQTGPNYRVGTLDKDGTFTDRLKVYITRADLQLALGQFDATAVGKKLVFVQSHAWWVGVAKPNDVANPVRTLKITENTFSVTITKVEGIATNPRLFLTTSYVVKPVQP